MTDDTTPIPLNEPEDDETARLLRRALTQEADMVHPDDRLATITDRIEDERRPRWVPVLAAAAGVAAVALVTGLAFGLGDDDPITPAASSPAASPVPTGTGPEPTDEAPTRSPTPSATESPTETAPPASGDTLPVYWVGEQGSRFALFREFGQPGPADPAARVQAAVDSALGGSPADPDYTSPWADGSGADITVSAGEIAIDLNAAAAGSSMGSEPAALAVQQLVWTATAAAQQDVPVRFTVEGRTADLFGTVSTAEPISRGRGSDDPRALVWITAPVEGGTVRGAAPEIRGEGVNAFENTLVWRIERGDTVVDEGFFGVTGPGGEVVDTGQRGVWTLEPERLLEPGTYTLTVEVPDASDGETTVRWFDTKTFTVG